jgi:predicted dienelactone hydrolase
MKINGLTRRQLLIVAATLSLARFAPAAPYSTPQTPNATWKAEWQDVPRNRTVPVKIYYPTGPGLFPVIIFSHGLGGSRDGYGYLGDNWSRHGYVSVHLQHIGSDDSVWRGGGGIQALKLAMNGKTALDRAYDVSFAIDQLESLNKTATSPLYGKLDLSKIGMAGHSFGANTTLLVSGLRLLGTSYLDKRIKCAVALSSPPPTGKNYGAIYGAITIPIFHMTGTNDVSPIDTRNFTAQQRRIPFDNIKGADGYLTTFAGGDHMVFSGQRRGAPVASDERNHLLIQESTTAFWDAYLKDDAQALAWLRNDYAGELGASGTFEQKVVR